MLALWEAGGRRCCCCGEPVPPPDDFYDAPFRLAPTLEHVFPSNPRGKDLKRLATLKAAAGIGGRTAGRKAIAHHACNHDKGNRPPTACEVLFLMGVNARLPSSRRHVIARIRAGVISKASAVS